MLDHSATLSYVRTQRLYQDYVYVASMALLAYDYILMLPLEIKHIWFSKWTYTKVVFLLVRYMLFVCFAIILNNQMAIDVPERVCIATFRVAVWLLKINIVLSEVILAIRTWAIWRQNRIIGVGLAVLTVTFVVASCILMRKLVAALRYGPGLYSGFRGCVIWADIRTIMFDNYALTSTFQAVVLTLVATSAFRLYRSGNRNELSHVIHRDGILSYVYLLCISLGSMIVVSAVPVELVTILAPVESVMYSVFATRTVLNIRGAVNKVTLTSPELHTNYETSEPPLPLMFSQNPSIWSHS